MRFLVALLLFFCLLPATGETAPQIQLRDLKEAAALGNELYANSRATGLVLVVVRGKEVFFRGYGETAPGSHSAPTEDSVVRLCSLTKTFTTDMLARLAASGVVRLNEPLANLAPPGMTAPELGAPITLENLATHTAGLEREIGTAPRRTPHFTYPDFETRWNWLQHTQLLYTPGTQALYSNVGFDLLSDALADATKTPYPTLLEQRTLEPLRMWQTTFYPSAEQCARLLRGSLNEGPCTATDNTMGSSGLYSTPEDMAHWLRHLLDEGAPAQTAQTTGAEAVYLLPSSLKRQYGLSHAGQPSGIGLAWMHLGATGDLSHLIEKTGGGAGFITYIAIHPASHTALFVGITEGRYGWRPGFNLFKASNNGLLALAGLPPLPETSRSRAAARRTTHTARLVRVKKRHRATQPAHGTQQGSAGQ